MSIALHIAFSALFLVINVLSVYTSINITSEMGQIKLVTDAIIFIIDIVLIIASISNLDRNRMISNQLSSYIKTVNINNIKNDRLKKLIGQCYKNKNPDDVDIVFSDNEIHELTGNGMQPIISNTMTALGVLGTFIGLIIGLSSLGNTTDSIINGIDGLIPGMKTAFTTSIVGLGLSTSYNFFFRHSQVKLYANINQIKTLIIREKINIGNAKDLDGLSSVLQQFCEQSIQLVESIKKKAESAEQRVADAEQRLCEQLKNFEQVTSKKLKEYFDSTTEINIKHIENTFSAFEKIQLQLLTGIQEQHKLELINLSKLYNQHDTDFFNKLSQWMNVIEKHQSYLRESQANIEAQQHLLQEKQEAVNSNIDRLIESEQNILGSMQEISKNIDEAYEKVSLAYKDLNEATDKMKDSDEKLVNTVGILDSTIQKLSENTEDLKHALAESTETVKNNLMTICETMNSSTEMCKTTSETIEKQIAAINTQTEEVKEQSSLIDKQQEVVERYITKLGYNTDKIEKVFNDGTDNIANTLEAKITQLRDTAVGQLERLEKAAEFKVESNVKKVVEQECKSIENILKAIEAVSTQIQRYNSTIKDNESKSNRIVENVELSKSTLETSLANAELLNKDLDSIHKYLQRIEKTLEKLESTERIRDEE